MKIYYTVISIKPETPLRNTNEQSNNRTNKQHKQLFIPKQKMSSLETESQCEIYIVEEEDEYLDCESESYFLILPLSKIEDFIYLHLGDQKRKEEAALADGRPFSDDLLSELEFLWWSFQDDPTDMFYSALCNTLEYFAEPYIIRPLESFGFTMDPEIPIEEIFVDFETQSALVAKRSTEVAALKEVWVNMALSGSAMCDVVQHILIPILVQWRMAELRSLKKYYSEYLKITNNFEEWVYDQIED